MTDAELDQLILSQADSRWLKVVMVLAKTSRAAEKSGVVLDDDTIYARLVHLVSSGQLEAVGDITDWRHSEVRLPH